MAAMTLDHRKPLNKVTEVRFLLGERNVTITNSYFCIIYGLKGIGWSVVNRQIRVRSPLDNPKAEMTKAVILFHL